MLSPTVMMALPAPITTSLLSIVRVKLSPDSSGSSVPPRLLTSAARPKSGPPGVIVTGAGTTPPSSRTVGWRWPGGGAGGSVRCAWAVTNTGRRRLKRASNPRKRLSLTRERIPPDLTPSIPLSHLPPHPPGEGEACPNTIQPPGSFFFRAGVPPLPVGGGGDGRGGQGVRFQAAPTTIASWEPWSRLETALPVWYSCGLTAPHRRGGCLRIPRRGTDGDPPVPGGRPGQELRQHQPLLWRVAGFPAPAGLGPRGRAGGALP